MIDTDKYEGHTEGPWEWGDDEEWSKNALVVYTINGKESLGVTKPHDPKKPDAQLIADAPLLLAEVKRLRKLRKQLEDCKRQIQFTADWIRDRGEDTHAKELDEFLEWME